MIGVVADDITGANDIGIMFAKSNYTVDVYSSIQSEDKQLNGTDVLILDTNSRFDEAKTAYQKVFQATKELHKRGVTQFFNKTCSVFRGNIGAEFDAMLDALDEDFAIVVLGFPKNGRKTIQGIHYVHGQPLEDSEFRHDPVHPMTCSILVDILKSQTNRKVTNIKEGIIKQGSEILRETIYALKKDYQYVIMDVTDQADLQTIANTVYDFKILAGSSALAEELPAVIGKKPEQTLPKNVPEYHQGKGIFCAAGSLMPQTFEQIEYMRARGASVFELDSLCLLDKERFTSSKTQLLNVMVTEINQGKNVILHSTNDPLKVKETKQKAFQQGISNREISQLVSSTLAEMTKAVLQQTGQKRFVIAGGDTSAAVCHRLNISGMRVWKEIQPGLPSCISLKNDPMLFVLKSGSFGHRDFIKQAFLHLKEQLLEPGGVVR
ncbi:four-carbon acid sugar kinase family protein [Metabacillus sp. Hm71]|uniref:four-carbon acid sugar kinase family protein n=1 Tax=Metabacillus sp. Hm71 TaxID=3450743 RepID=UPI003F42958F